MPSTNPTTPGRATGRGLLGPNAVVKPHEKYTPPDFAGIASAALDAAPRVVSHWLSGGKREGPEYVACNPTRKDSTPGSFKVNLVKGVWTDFATGDAGSDLISLVAYVDGCSQTDAALSVGSFLGMSTHRAEGPTARRQPASNDGGTIVAPIPDNAAEPPRAHPKHGAPSAIWTYRDAVGASLFHVCRFDLPNGTKEVLPLSLWATSEGNRWRWKGHPEPRPLYGLDRLAARPDAPVVVCEGEKDADAAAQLLPVFVAVTSPNGSKSAGRTDWRPLKGRRAVMWADADASGELFAADVERLALAAGSTIGRIDLGAIATLRGSTLPKGWGASDALAEGIDAHELEQLASDALRPPEPGTPPVFTHVDLRGLATAATDPVFYAVALLVPRGVVTLLGSHGGAGKTNLALIFCAHVAAGRSWGPFWCEQGRVLFVSLEDPGQRIRGTLARIVREYRLDPDLVAANVMVIDGTASESALAAEHTDYEHGKRLVETRAYREMRELAATGFDLVVVDNASDAFDGNENERRQVRKFVRGMLGSIARENNLAVLLLAHIDKSAAKFGAKKNSYSGSTAWHNSARSRIAIIDDEKTGLELVHEKLNLGKMAEPLPLRWSDSGVLVPGTRAGAESSAELGVNFLEAAADADAVEATIAAAMAADTNVPTARSGCKSTHVVLKTFPDLPRDLRTGKGKDRFWAAITALERTGRIRIESYEDKYRHTAQRFALAVNAVNAAKGGFTAIDRISADAAANARGESQGVRGINRIHRFTADQDAEAFE